MANGNVASLGCEVDLAGRTGISVRRQVAEVGDKSVEIECLKDELNLKTKASSHFGISVLPLSKSRANRASTANILREQSLLSDLGLIRL